MTWIAPGGGVDEQVKLSILGMHDEFEFHLLTGREIQSPDFKDIPGLQIHVCKWMVPEFNPLMDLFAYFWIRKFLARNEFDLVHTHETKSSFLTRLALKKNTMPLIYGIHGVVFNDPRSRIGNKIYEILERFTINRAMQIIAVSEDVKSEYWRRGIGVKLPWSVIYSGVDVSRFHLGSERENQSSLRLSLGIRESDQVLVNIGRFSKSKNKKDSILALTMDKDVVVAIETSMGTIKVKLYNETPLHKANFIKLCHNNFYNDIIFHRVISNFMIQAGDPNSKAAIAGETYGNGGPGYTVPAEFVPHLRHKKGALAAARLGDMQNPRKESSGSQFYICHVETPSLDNQYSVFGETIKGFDVIDKIANLKRDPNDRPLEDVKIISTKLVY
jgi:cyclophilin family peptidyl-prolyl cis-trans isomerase